VKLLEREPATEVATPPQPSDEQAGDGAAAEPGARACTSCGAQLEPGQEWCLSCGTASGRLDERPGWRAAMTVLGLTLLLVTGAVAAAYAALGDEPAPSPAAPAPVAQAPPAAAPAPTTPTTPTTPDGSSTSGDDGGKDLPKIDPPSSSSGSSGSSPTPATPAPSSSTPATPPTPAPSSPSTGSSTGSSTTPGSTGTTTTPKAPAAQQLEIASSAVSVYDPYGKATAAGSPAKAIDGQGGTSWYVDAAPGATQIGIGYAVNLGKPQGIRRVEITTPTPGFRVEIYATDEATPPPNILDSRWAHISDRSKVGAKGDGAERIVLGAGSSKYQTLLLWITQPPESGTRVRISELKIFG
jgi:hypothetical protein